MITSSLILLYPPHYCHIILASDLSHNNSWDWTEPFSSLSFGTSINQQNNGKTELSSATRKQIQEELNEAFNFFKFQPAFVIKRMRVKSFVFWGGWLTNAGNLRWGTQLTNNLSPFVLSDWHDLIQRAVKYEVLRFPLGNKGRLGALKIHVAECKYQ